MERIKNILNLRVVSSKPSKMPTRNEFLSTYRTQTFSLPSSIIYYIARNPSTSKTYQKWIKICKYFFIKNPILVFNSFFLDSTKLQNLMDSNTKIWISDGFIVPPPALDGQPLQPLFSSMMTKLYKCDVKRLHLFDISLNFDEFCFLSSSASSIRLMNVSIKYRNGKDVELEKLVEECSNAKMFEFKFQSNPSNFSSKTLKNLIQIPHFSTLEIFRLVKIPDTFDVKPLIEFLKKTDLYVSLDFCEILSEKYRNQLDEIMFEILESDEFIYGPPSLKIPGINFDLQMALLRKARTMKM